MNWALYGKRRHTSVVYTHAILEKWLNQPSKDLRKRIQRRTTHKPSGATATLSDHVSQTQNHILIIQALSSCLSRYY